MNRNEAFEPLVQLGRRIREEAAAEGLNVETVAFLPDLDHDRHGVQIVCHLDLEAIAGGAARREELDALEGMSQATAEAEAEQRRTDKREALRKRLEGPDGFLS